MVGTLKIVDRHVDLDGLVTEISQGGVLFRTASTYILFRLDEDVMVTIRNKTFAGKIVATATRATASSSRKKLSAEFIEEVATHYGVAKQAFQEQPAAA